MDSFTQKEIVVEPGTDMIFSNETLGCDNHNLEFDEGINSSSRLLIYESCHKASQSAVVDSKSFIYSKKSNFPGNN